MEGWLALGGERAMSGGSKGRAQGLPTPRVRVPAHAAALISRIAPTRAPSCFSFKTNTLGRSGDHASLARHRDKPPMQAAICRALSAPAEAVARDVPAHPTRQVVVGAGFAHLNDIIADLARMRGRRANLPGPHPKIDANQRR